MLSADNKWDKKQGRELFCKTVNALMMTDKDLEVKKAMEMAEEVVKRALTLFPPTDEKGEAVVNLPD